MIHTRTSGQFRVPSPPHLSVTRVWEEAIEPGVKHANCRQKRTREGRQSCNFFAGRWQCWAPDALCINLDVNLLLLLSLCLVFLPDFCAEGSHRSLMLEFRVELLWFDSLLHKCSVFIPAVASTVRSQKLISRTLCFWKQSGWIWTQIAAFIVLYYLCDVPLKINSINQPTNQSINYSIHMIGCLKSEESGLPTIHH